jgi:hypothetical protein
MACLAGGAGAGCQAGRLAHACTGGPRQQLIQQRFQLALFAKQNTKIKQKGTGTVPMHNKCNKDILTKVYSF